MRSTLRLAGMTLFLATLVGQTLPVWASAVPRFPSRFTYYTTPNDFVISTVVGDVNGDGWPDVLTRNAASGNYSLLLGSPTGKLTPTGGTLALEPNEIDMTLARVDGDLLDDLVIANYIANTVTIRPSLASGGFGPPQTISVPASPRAIACGDLNGDGRTDLVVATLGDFKLRSYLQQPDGSFVLSATTDAPPTPTSVVLADVDGNGTLDALVLGTSALRIESGAGDGSFSQINAYSPGGTQVQVGDFNHDGILDFVIGGGSAPNPITVLLGTGGGGYGLPIQPFTGTSARLVAVGDWNGDGSDDLAIGATDIRIYAGGENPTFGFLSVVPGPPSEQIGAAADFDGDGHLDMVLASASQKGVSVAHGNGNGTFGDTTAIATTLPYSPLDVAFGDVDGDGHMDAAILGASDVRFFVTAADGTPVAAGTAALPRAATHIALHDMNGDGLTDLVALLASPGAVQVSLNQGNGTFVAKPEHATSTTSPHAFAVGPIDANGTPDAVVAESGVISGYMGLGNGAFQSTYYTSMAQNPSLVVLDDMDGDARLDAVVQDNGAIYVYPGSGAFCGPAISEASGALVAVGNVDQIGEPDIVVYNSANHLFYLYPSTGSDHFGSPVTIDPGPGATTGVFGDVDGDGNLDFVVEKVATHVITILCGHGGGVFGPEQESVGVDVPGAPMLADLNGDGALDLFLVGTNQFTVLPQNTAQIAADPRPPTRIALSATPNPARGPVSLGYSMPRSGSVQLGIYDLHGRLVRELIAGTKPAGEYRQPWDGKDGVGVRVPAGVYFARGSFGGQHVVTKVVQMN